ncbi:MAG: hypothetical protein V1745_00965 [Patescibacteria group bacterium]
MFDLEGTMHSDWNGKLNLLMYHLLRQYIPSTTFVVSLPLGMRPRLLEIVRRDMEDASVETGPVHDFWLVHSGRPLRELTESVAIQDGVSRFVEMADADDGAVEASGCFLPGTARVLEDFLMTALLTVRNASVRVSDPSDPTVKGLLSPEVPFLLLLVSCRASCEEAAA